MVETTIVKNEKVIPTSKKKINVGLIMPIAEIAGLSETHWDDVRRIIKGQ